VLAESHLGICAAVAGTECLCHRKWREYRCRLSFLSDTELIIEREVHGSQSLRFFMSTVNSKLSRKAPMIASVTLATMNVHKNGRLKPKFKLRVRCPNTAEPSADCKSKPAKLRALLSLNLAGTTLTSAPVYPSGP
jgi:hypothetical protein